MISANYCKIEIASKFLTDESNTDGSVSKFSFLSNLSNILETLYITWKPFNPFGAIGGGCSFLLFHFMKSNIFSDLL